MKFTFYGHACFCIEFNETKILFDPFISGNDLAKHIDLDTIEANYIALTHGHADHIADCETIALRTGAKVICNWEIHEWLNTKGISNTHPMNTGGKWRFPEFSLKCVTAQHSSGLPDGSYGGNPMGFILFAEEKSIYISGDTALTMDMQLIPKWAKIDAAILPIGDNFTMGYEDAILAAQFAGTSKVVGVHFDTFGYIKIDAETVKAEFAKANFDFHLPSIGETHEL